MKRRDVGETAWTQQTRAELAAVLAAVRDPGEMAALLGDLCTPAELEALADRWAVVPRLAAGTPYRQIHEETGVSVTTVGRVARCWDHGAGGYRAAHALLQGAEGPAPAHPARRDA